MVDLAPAPTHTRRRPSPARDPRCRRLQRVRRRRRPHGRRDDAAPDHRRPRARTARRSRRRGLDRQRLPDRVHRGDADRGPHQRRDRPAANVPRRVLAVHRSGRSSSRCHHRRRSVRSCSAVCSPHSAAGRWCLSRSAVIGDVYPEGRRARALGHARRDRDARLGVGPAVRRHARPVPVVAVAVLAQHPARDHRRGRGVVGAR